MNTLNPVHNLTRRYEQTHSRQRGRGDSYTTTRFSMTVVLSTFRISFGNVRDDIKLQTVFEAGCHPPATTSTHVEGIHIIFALPHVANAAANATTIHHDEFAFSEAYIVFLYKLQCVQS